MVKRMWVLESECLGSSSSPGFTERHDLTWLNLTCIICGQVGPNDDSGTHLGTIRSVCPYSSPCTPHEPPFCAGGWPGWNSSTDSPVGCNRLLPQQETAGREKDEGGAVTPLALSFSLTYLIGCVLQVKVPVLPRQPYLHKSFLLDSGNSSPPSTLQAQRWLAQRYCTLSCGSLYLLSLCK